MKSSRNRKHTSATVYTLLTTAAAAAAAAAAEERAQHCFHYFLLDEQLLPVAADVPDEGFRLYYKHTVANKIR